MARSSISKARTSSRSRERASREATQCTLLQNGEVVWDNLRDDGRLDTDGECRVDPGHRKHRAFMPGPTTLVVKDFLGRAVTSNESRITFELCMQAPKMVYPQPGAELALGGSYMFKVAEPRGIVHCALWQGGELVWSALSENGECALHPADRDHARMQPGAAEFVARGLVDRYYDWSDRPFARVPTERVIVPIAIR